MKRWGLPFGLLLVALCGAFYYQQIEAGARAGFPAPDFALPDLQGHVHHLSDFRGKIVFLNLWATWCPPCRMEIPSMERLHRRLAGKDFAMLAVSEDEGGRTVVQPFVAKMGITFPVLMDSQGEVPSRYGVTGFPETFIIDRAGKVIQHAIGPEDWDSDEAVAYFTHLLDSGPATLHTASN